MDTTVDDIRRKRSRQLSKSSLMNENEIVRALPQPGVTRRPQTYEARVAAAEDASKLQYLLSGNRAQRQMGQQLLEQRRLDSRLRYDRAINNNLTRNQMLIDNQRLKSEFDRERIAKETELDAAIVNARSALQAAQSTNQANAEIARHDRDARKYDSGIRLKIAQTEAGNQASALETQERIAQGQRDNERAGQTIQALMMSLQQEQGQPGAAPIDHNLLARQIALIQRIESNGLSDEDMAFLMTQINADRTLTPEQREQKIRDLHKPQGQSAEFLPYLMNAVRGQLQGQGGQASQGGRPAAPQPINLN